VIGQLQRLIRVGQQDRIVLSRVQPHITDCLRIKLLNSSSMKLFVVLCILLLICVAAFDRIRENIFVKDLSEVVTVLL